jgi:redox-sensitive bicupin YhaK (pirin superfamily)
MFGAQSPVRTASKTVYADIRFSAEAELTLPDACEELAVYALDADIQVDGTVVQRGTLGVLSSSNATKIRATAPSRVMLIGGAPLDGHRFIWWNFVSSMNERISRAAEAWEQQRFGQVPGEVEFTPLPERRPNSWLGNRT